MGTYQDGRQASSSLSHLGRRRPRATTTALPPIPPREIHQFLPGNYPYLAFAEDAPWFINAALGYHLVGSRMSIFGLIRDRTDPMDAVAIPGYGRAHAGDPVLRLVPHDRSHRRRRSQQ